MITNIYYLLGFILLLYNLALMRRYRDMALSVEWLSLYKSKNKSPDRKRVNFRLVNLWMISSICSSLWLFFGVIVENSLLFTFLFSMNIIANYFLSKNSGTVKIKLSLVKTVVFNLILLTLIVNYFVGLFHQ